MVDLCLMLALRMQRHTDLCEFKACLLYTVSSRPSVRTLLRRPHP